MILLGLTMAGIGAIVWIVAVIYDKIRPTSIEKLNEMVEEQHKKAYRRWYGDDKKIR